MTKIVWAFCFLPVLLLAQQSDSKKKTNAAAKNEAAANSGFVIEGTVTGYPDGTKISLLNGQSGQPEQQGGIYKDKFRFVGKVDAPSFKILLINQKPPYLTLFLDNSNVSITGSSEAFEKATVTGSKSHAEYAQLASVLDPYQAILTGTAQPTEPQISQLKTAIQQYLQSNGGTYAAPMAIIRYTQVTEDFAQAEAWYNLLTPAVRNTDMARYVAQQVAENKSNGIGSVLADFSQADTAGKSVSLSSFRGKYVLVDFWASWCRPCRMENPNVVANYLKFKDKNFTVLGVSLDKSKPAWLEAIQADGLTWSHVSDLQGWGNAVAQQFRISSIPQNFLIGPDGKVIAKNLRGSALESRLTELLK